MKLPFIIGTALLFFGIYLQYWINRKRFNRFGSDGLQHFFIREKNGTTKTLERLGTLLAYISIFIGFALSFTNL